MNKTQNTKLSSDLTVEKVCNDNQQVWNGVPAFVSAIGEYVSLLDSVRSTLSRQGINIKGVTLDKKAVKKDLTDITLEVAGAVYAFAADTKNLSLKAKVAITSSNFDHLRGSELLAFCNTVYSEAVAITAQLVDYGITQNEMNNFQGLLTNFSSQLPAPRAAISDRKGATDELAKLFARIDIILKEKLDKLMHKFRLSDPDFYRLYFDARIIVDIGGRHKPPAPAENEVIPPVS